MTVVRKPNGYFDRGTKPGPGRPKGSRNKPPPSPFMEDGDTSSAARRFKALIDRMVNDLGGMDDLTAGQAQLIKRCAMLSVQCELMETQAIEGADLNTVVYGQLTGHLARTLSVLGLKREARDITPALHAYLDEPDQIEPPTPPELDAFPEPPAPPELDTTSDD
jgi:hypothetical protein